MARVEIGVVEVRDYIFASTDSTDLYPTSTECAAGSMITLVNTSTHEVTGYLLFDGTNWNTI